VSPRVSIAPVATGDFTAKEVANVRAALRFLHVRCGTWAALARVIGFKESTLGNIAGGHKPVTATLAVRIAKFAKVGVDDVLTGQFPAPGTCPHCGHVTIDVERRP
jgi:hypothetical protein